LGESLILVPVRIEEHIELIVEVVQRPSGGPAAQRGYLRFVAQMADLVADYVRREKLRWISHRERLLEQHEDWYARIATRTTRDERNQAAAQALSELLGGEQALLLRTTPGVRALAASGTNALDSRSEIVIAATKLARQLVGQRRDDHQTADWRDGQWYHASARRGSDEPSIEQTLVKAETQALVDQLCQSLRGRRLLCIGLHDHHDSLAILSFASDALERQQIDATWMHAAVRTGRCIGALLPTTGGQRLLPRSLSADSSAAWHSHRRLATLRWAAWILPAMIGVAAALFPVPQQISATATLRAENKRTYYAPSNAIVQNVFVKEDQSIAVNTPLLKLTSRELDNEIDRLNAQYQQLEEQIAELEMRLSLGVASNSPAQSAQEQDQIDSELKVQKVSQRHVQQQLEFRQQQRSELSIVAAEPGHVATWNLQNRLVNR
ncbi:MAG: hypothetical protein KDA51_04005, partial [Planctomycetales bacterium]|nr:hypothetical protein [Planctomycetales bacterium]